MNIDSKINATSFSANPKIAHLNVSYAEQRN